MDPKLPRDLCHAYDCVMPEGCTMLTQGAGAGRDLMILPRWRTQGLRFWLKEWNPELADGIVWLLRKAGTNSTFLRLEIGADKNEKIKLFLVRGGIRQLVEEKEHSHVIPIGQWAGMWLKFLLEGGLEVGREGSENPLFAWKPKKVPAANFFPERVSYASLAGHTIGVVFPCEECHVEITYIRNFTKVLPLTLWQREPLAQPPNNLTLYMRGHGAALVPLIMQPGEGDYHAVTLAEGKGADRIYLLKQKAGNLSEVGKVRLPQPIFSKDKWTKIIIRWTEMKLRVWWNGLLYFAVDTKEPLVAYFFSVGIEDGEMMWTANCEPPDVDSPAVDGGWSEWGPATACSATCGGGWGQRRRRCDNPPPTLRGRDCEGEDIMDEQCNTFPCGQLAPGTDEVIRRMLRRHHAATEAEEGNNVTLACAGPALLTRVLQEAPEAVLYWEHQGRRVQGHVLTDLELMQVVPSASGVYTCWCSAPGSPPLALHVQSLAVRPAAPQHMRATRPLRLLCRAAALGRVFAGLAISWQKPQGDLREDFGVIDPAAVETFEVTVDTSSAGEWKCVVEQQELGFRWTTNWLRITVDHPPTYLSRVADDLGLSESVLVIVTIFVILVTVLLAFGGAVFYLRFLRLPVSAAYP